MFLGCSFVGSIYYYLVGYCARTALLSEKCDRFMIAGILSNFDAVFHASLNPSSVRELR